MRAGGSVQQNPLSLVITLASIAISGLCCLFGVGFSMYMSFAARSAATAPPAAYAPPSYAPPAYPTPAYPTPVAAPTPELPATTVQLAITADTPTRGPENAPITIHVVSEFQCPFCARVEPTLAQLDAANPGRIRWVWHDYPLAFHANAMPAAEAAREVRRQLGDAAFWRFHDMLFENQRDLSAPTLERLAGQMPGLDLGAFRSALATHVHEPAIRAAMAQVQAAQGGGSVGTPCFLIQGRWLRGAQPLASFQSAIDQR
jgi:protein-disulfide isomerase